MTVCLLAGIGIAMLLTIFSKPKPPDQIKDEVNGLTSHHWAGHYSTEIRGVDEGPLNVWLSPSGGAFAETLDWWNVHELGRVAENKGVLNIDWENPNRTQQFPTEVKMVRAKYGRDVYLLTIGELHPFCLAAKGNGEFPYGILRRLAPGGVTSKLSPQANIELPSQYEPIIDLPPIELRVIEAEPIHRMKYSDGQDVYSQVVVIDRGSENRLFAGMEFGPKGNSDSFPMIVIQTTARNESRARMRYFIKSNENSPTAIQIGNEFETRR